MRIKNLMGILGATGALSSDPCVFAGNPIVWNNGTVSTRTQAGPTSQLSASASVSSQAADDFLVGGAGVAITDVHWSGVYVPASPLPNPGPSFTIRFYADNGTGASPTGGPGDPSATALATYTTGVGGGHQVANGLYFDYAYVLPTTFEASSGVKYWLSIQAVFNSPPQWFWGSSTTNHLSHAVFGSTGAFLIPHWSDTPANEVSEDVAFALSGILHCPGEITGDGAVNVDDLLEIIGEWGPCASPCFEDIDGDGVVNVDDLLAVIVAWGACP